MFYAPFLTRSEYTCTIIQKGKSKHQHFFHRKVLGFEPGYYSFTKEISEKLIFDVPVSKWLLRTIQHDFSMVDKKHEAILKPGSYGPYPAGNVMSELTTIKLEISLPCLGAVIEEWVDEISLNS